MQSNSELSWGITICTYNRPHFLIESLKFTLNQTRPPAEVVIVDASDNWAETYDKFLTTYATHWESINLVYQPAKVRGLTHQRNQALEASQSDVIFSLDDDIYMAPDAANAIMLAYELDPAGEIAMIGGHFIEHSPDTPADAPTHDQSITKPGVLERIKQRLEQLLSLDHHFVPYDAPIDTSAIPKPIADLGVQPTGLINGGRTTFRRRIGLQVKWSQLLRYYSTHEDSDFSYRMSKHGRMLVAPHAGFFHADGNDSRLSRFRVNTIRVRNLMALHRVWSNNKVRSSWRLAGSFLFFMGLYLLIDPARKRFTLPCARAYAYGALQVPFFMFYPFEDFKAWYIELQQKMYNSR